MGEQEQWSGREGDKGKKIPPGCRNFETAAVGKFHFWSIQTCCYQSMELRCNSAVSYGSLLSIYRMGRKVKHLGGGSEALHGIRVGFSYKAQCRHNFYNNLHAFHLMESYRVVYNRHSHISQIQIIPTNPIFYYCFQTLHFFGRKRSSSSVAPLQNVKNQPRKNVKFFQSHTTYILSQMHRIRDSW